MKKVVVLGVGCLAALYILNPTAGVFELIPDNLPLVGNLFKSSINVDDRTELLIFVTPKILQGANLNIR